MTVRSDFEPVPLPGAGNALPADVAAWAAAPPVCALVAAFADNAADRDLVRDLESGRGTVAERLARLHAFSQRWDTRRTGERNQATELALTDEQARLILAAASALGMRGGARPRFRHYSHLLVLGGSVRGCLARPAYGAHLVRDGQVTAGSVVALGGHRPFAGDEFALAAAAGVPELTEEYSALDHGMRTAFEVDEPEAVHGEDSPVLGGTWGVRRYRTAAGTPVQVLAAPSTEPGKRRADTSDTFVFFAAQPTAPRPSARLLVVTSQINVPAQHASAVRVLGGPLAVEVDTVGVEPGFGPPALAREFSATEYLLEVRSTIRSLRRLLAGR